MVKPPTLLTLEGEHFSLALSVNGYAYAPNGEDEDNYLEGSAELIFRRVGHYQVSQATILESSWVSHFADELEAILQQESGKATLIDIDACVELTIRRGAALASGPWVCCGHVRPTWQADFSFQDIALEAAEIRRFVDRLRAMVQLYPPRFDAAGT